jgi:hypothetical protein
MPVATLVGGIAGAVIAVLLHMLLIALVAVTTMGWQSLYLAITGALYYAPLTSLYYGFIPGAILGFVSSIVFCFTTIPSSRRRWLIVSVVSLPVGIAISAGVLYVIFTYYIGVTRVVNQEMWWVYGTETCTDGTPMIALVNGIHHLPYCSAELVRYLESIDTRTVSVQFNATYDYGNIRGYHVRQIGNFTNRGVLIAGNRGSITGCNREEFNICDEQGEPLYGTLGRESGVPWQE